MRFEIWCLDREGRPTWCTGRLTPPPNLERAIPLDGNPEATAPSFADWLAAGQQRPLTHSEKRASSVRESRSREGTGNSGREIRPVLLFNGYRDTTRILFSRARSLCPVSISTISCLSFCTFSLSFYFYFFVVVFIDVEDRGRADLRVQCQRSRLSWIYNPWPGPQGSHKDSPAEAR